MNSRVRLVHDFGRVCYLQELPHACVAYTFLKRISTVSSSKVHDQISF